MAIDYTLLFERVGAEGAGMNEVNTFRGTTLANRFTTVYDFYTSEDPDLVNNIWSYLSSAQTGVQPSTINYFQLLASQSLVRGVVTDVPLIAQSVAACMQELYDQMVDDGETISRPAVTVTVTAGVGNVGDTVCISGTKGPTGLQQDYMLAETQTVTCTIDAYGGRRPAYQEQFGYAGEALVDPLSWLWPGGSGSSGVLYVSDPGLNGVVSDGDFEGSWTGTGSNTPPSPWDVNVGTIGTTVLRGASSLRGLFSLEFVGNGSQLTSVRQLVTLLPRTVYGANCFYKLGTASPAAGVLAMRLTDVNGTVIDDLQATPNTVSATLTAVADTDWHALNTQFRTPDTLPAAIYLELILTTAYTNARTLFLDCVQMAAGTQLAPGGPYANLFSGGTQATKGDFFTVVSTNDGSTATFGRLFDRFFGMRTLGIQLPSAPTGTISNALIQ